MRLEEQRRARALWRRWGLSNRVAAVLSAAGIGSVAQLSAMTDGELLRIPGLGRVAFVEVQNALDRIPETTPPAPVTDLRRWRLMGAQDHMDGNRGDVPGEIRGNREAVAEWLLGWRFMEDKPQAPEERSARALESIAASLGVIASQVRPMVRVMRSEIVRNESPEGYVRQGDGQWGRIGADGKIKPAYVVDGHLMPKGWSPPQ